MVMAENDEVRKNRLALLSELLREFYHYRGFFRDGGEGRS